jgi:hypothetical protein
MQRSDDSRYFAAERAAERYHDRVHNDLRFGAVAGLLGGASIMILFFVYDVLFFTPLATPDFLSDLLLGREALAADIAVRLRAVRIAIFTVVHLAAFTALGIVLANLFRISGVRKSLLLGGLYGLSVCTLLFRAGLHLSGTELLTEPEWPAVMLGNFLAGVVMVGYLQARTSLQK